MLSFAVLIVVLAIGRSVYRARRDQDAYANHHKIWLPLSEDEMKMWRFTPLKSRSTTRGGVVDADEAKDGGDDSTSQAGDVGKTPPATSDKGVMQGWKITCESLPCQQLLPGSLGTGGIVSVEGTFNTCFDLILGDDALTISPTSFAGVALVTCARGSDYIMVNTHEGSWQGESSYQGNSVFSAGKKFQLNLKFLKGSSGSIEFVVEVDKKQLLKRTISEYVVNSFKKLDVRTGNFRGCNEAGPGPTKFDRIEYLSR